MTYLSKRKKIAYVSIVILLLISLYFSLDLTQGNDNSNELELNPKTTATPQHPKETFTWVSHVVNASVAEQLFQMHFTDVAVRYVTEEEVVISQSNLARYGVDLWLVIDPTLFKGDYSQNDFKATLNLQTKGGITNFIIDDANWLWYSGYFTTEAKNNFLYAMYSYGDKVLITLMESDANWIIAQGFSFAGLNVDLYNCPNIYHKSFDQNFNSQTLGIYLWCWDWNGTRPNGRDWDSVSLAEIIQVYSFCSAQRMYIWLADENNTVEVGMETSSFLNYPDWWNTITVLNQAYLNSNFHQLYFV
jgi:hypothetical protein